jgi:hypothetical protein
LLTAAAVAAGLVLTPVVASAAQDDVTWDVETCVLASPAFGAPTTQVRVSGCGFASYEPVEVTFGSSLVARAVTNGLGRFRTEFNVPPTAAGATLVKAVGLVSDRYNAMNFVVVSEIWNMPPANR